jgi:hypothetical protein
MRNTMKTEQAPAPRENQPDPARRSLLKAAPLGALAIAAAGRAQAVEPPAPVAGLAPAKPQGYHETEHIRKYYRTAAYW